MLTILSVASSRVCFQCGLIAKYMTQGPHVEHFISCFSRVRFQCDPSAHYIMQGSYDEHLIRGFIPSSVFKLVSGYSI